MVVKALYYFLAFFFIVVIVLLSQEPYKLEFFDDNGTKPAIEFNTIQNYNIDESGIKMFAKARNAKRFNDRDILYDVDAYAQKENILETLKSDNATLKGDIVYLNGNVIYTRDNDMVLKTEQIEYDQKKEILVGKTPFELDNAKSTSFGDSFIYYSKTGKLEAQKIKAIIKVEEK